MEQILMSHGGLFGVLAVIILLLVKEVVSTRNKSGNCSGLHDKVMTKELCEERHTHISDSLVRLEGSVKETSERVDRNLAAVTDLIRELPSKINGGV